MSNFLRKRIHGWLLTALLALGSTVAWGQSVVVNKYLNNGTSDIVELLVIQNNLDLRGMILKDFSASMANDGGRQFTFTTNALWSAVPSGTLIILRGNDATAADIVSSDYLLDIGLSNSTYFTGSGGSFDIAATEMVMIKSAGSGTAGVTGNIHTLASGTAGTQYTNTVDGVKMRATATTGTGQYCIADNPNILLSDFSDPTAANGFALGGQAGPFTFGAGNNSDNTAYINSLRLGAPTVTLTPATPTLAYGSVSVSTTSASQSYQVEGTNLTANITITAPADFQLSLDNFATAPAPGGILTLTQTGGVVATTTIFARYAPTATGAVALNITNASTGAVTKNVAVTGNGITPSLGLSPTSLCFGVQNVGSSSASKQYTLTGSNLGTNDAVVTAPANFELSLDDFATAPVSALNIAPVAGNIAGTTIYVRLTPAGAGSFSSNITHTNAAPGCNAPNLALTGAGVTGLSAVVNTTPTCLNLNFGSINNGSDSPQQTFVVSGSNLGTNNLVINASDYYKVSLTSGGPFLDDPITIAPTAGTVSATTVYVIFRPTSGSNGSITGVLTVSSTGAPNQTVNVTGTEAGNIVVTPISTVRNAVDANCVTVYNNVSPWNANTTPVFNLRGHVYGVNTRVWGSTGIARMTLIDVTGGIYIDYSGSSTFGLSSALVEQDSVLITGYISNVTSGGNPVGRMIIVPTAITRYSQGNPLKTATNTTVLNEATEADYVRVTGVNITTAINFSNNIAANTTLAGTVSGSPVSFFIPTGSGLVGQNYGTVFNNTTTNLTFIGLGNQFLTGAGSKCSSGYEMILYGVAGVIPNTDPIVSVPPPTTLAFGNAEVSTLSTEQTISVSGSNIEPDITARVRVSVTGPFEIRLPAGTWVTTPIDITPDANGNVTNQGIEVRFAPVATGAVSGTVTVVSTGTTPISNTVTITLTGTGVAAGTPILSATVNPVDFGPRASSTTTELSTVLSSTNNTNLAASGPSTAVTATVSPTTYYGLSKVPGGPYTSTISFTRDEMNGAASGRTVYIRYAPAGAVTLHPANLSIAAPSSTPATTDLLINLSGFHTGVAGVLNYYRGNMHTHTGFSDGNKDAGSSGISTPAQSYTYAAASKRMDFMGIAEHNHSAAGMAAGNWYTGLTQAAAATTGSFVALYGMEWGTISGGGHFAVYGTDRMLSWENLNPGLDVAVTKGFYTTGTPNLTEEMYNRLTAPVGGAGPWPRAIAFFCHPNSSDYNGIINTARTGSAGSPTQSFKADSIIVGTAVRSGPAFSTTTNYADSPGGNFTSQWNTALRNGHHLGPVIDHDSHNSVFGRSTRARTVVLADALTQDKILEGFQKMRFYASLDWNAEVEFTVNGQVMGSDFQSAGAPTLSIKVNDVNIAGELDGGQVLGAETSSTIQVIAGSIGGSSPSAITTFNTVGNNTAVTYTDNSLADLQQKFYYAIITQADGDVIWTSPIWYKRNNSLAPLPVRFIAFNGVPENNGVMLRWSTASEINNDRFEIERSTDGVTFTKIGAQIGNGTTNNVSQYSYFDGSLPVAPKLYYRLKQVDYNGEFEYSPTVEVNFTGDKEVVQAPWQLYPNPYTGSSDLQLVSIDPNVKLTDVFSYSIITQQGEVLAQGSAPLTELGNRARKAVITAQAGVYLVKVSGKNGTFTLRLVKA